MRQNFNIMELTDLFRISQNLVQSTQFSWHRYLYTQINWNQRMLCIKGARGIGKTTMMLQRIREQFGVTDQAVYVSLDNLWFSDHRLLDLVDYHYSHGGTHLFVDEVHRYPYSNWVQEMKNIYDSYPGYHVVFSGSSLLKIDMSVADLSRRCAFYHMKGLSFREYLQMNHLADCPAFDLAQILSNHLSLTSQVLMTVKPLQHFSDYLKHGYYPYYQENEGTFEQALLQTVNTIIESDIPSAIDVERVTILKFKRLLHIISGMAPFTPNVSNLAHSLESSRNKIYEMLSVLEQAALIYNLYCGKQTMQQLVKPEKLYLENSNLLYALSADVSIGNARETFFANQLSQGHELAFSGKGDFLIDGRYTIEVGGRRKSFDQVKDVENSFLAIDDVEFGHGNRVPLWLFGFLY